MTQTYATGRPDPVIKELFELRAEVARLREAIEKRDEGALTINGSCAYCGAIMRTGSHFLHPAAVDHGCNCPIRTHPLEAKP